MLTHFDISPYPAIHSFSSICLHFYLFYALQWVKWRELGFGVCPIGLFQTIRKKKIGKAKKQIHTEFLLSNWANLFDQSKQSHGFRCLCNLQIDKMCVLHWPIMWKTLKRFKSRVKLKRVFGASSEFPWYVCCVYFWFILFHSAFAHRCCVHKSNAYNDFDG